MSKGNGNPESASRLMAQDRPCFGLSSLTQGVGTVVKRLIQQDKAISYLISKLDDETRIKGHVKDHWSEVRVADVALIILTDFFTDSSWQNTMVPGVGWDEFLERDVDRDLTSEQVLRNYISKHGRKAIKDRWQALWREYRDRLFWDENERCFRVTFKELQ